MSLSCRCSLSMLLVVVVVANARAVPWTVAARGAIALDTAAVSGVGEMSGVMMIGPSGGAARFAAVQDSGNQLVEFDVVLTANGTISSATATGTQALAPGFDFEGAAFTNPARNSLFLSEESTPAVREYSLADGSLLQTVLPPAVFSNIRSNNGFESLARSVGGTRMWTANEEALAIDGDVSSDISGTVVRLLEFDVQGGAVSPKSQYAYEVDPIHGATNDDARSGLVELVSLPDGTLLALERSLAAAFPPFQNRIYQIDLAGATDVSASEFETGLVGQSYTPVTKTLLWSGSIGGTFGSGENLEGVTLGPRLSATTWNLLGVVDDGDPLSNNTIVSFEITAPTCTLAGDYNCSGTVDRHDYDAWADTLGSSTVLFADGNQSGTIDAADYTVWRDHLGATAAAATASAVHVPEPVAQRLLMAGMLLLCGLTARRRR